MFTGFTDETLQFFLDLKFHNNTAFFHQEHDRYVETVQQPFYALIDELAPTVRKIDPLMEIRPHKCLSRIHRDTRFSKDKSPYRDHLWFLFRRAAEPREQSLFYYFEFGVDRLSWGMGIWGENRELMDQFRRKMRANPEGTLALLDDMRLDRRRLLPGGSHFRRMDIPPEIPERLKPWYTYREMYVGKMDPAFSMAFSEDLAPTLKKDFKALAPLYRLLRGMLDEMETKGE